VEKGQLKYGKTEKKKKRKNAPQTTGGKVGAAMPVPALPY